MSVLFTHEKHQTLMLRELAALRALVVAPAAVVATLGLLWGMERLIRAEELPPPPPEIYRVPDPVMVEPPPPQVLYKRPEPPKRVELEPEPPKLALDLSPPDAGIMPPPTLPPPTERPGLTGGFSDTPVATMLVQPTYPIAAANRGIEGYVDVQFDVTETGATTNVRILAAEPPKVFDKETINAVKRWKFSPVIKDGRPVPYLAMAQRVHFQMEKN